MCIRVFYFFLKSWYIYRHGKLSNKLKSWRRRNNEWLFYLFFFFFYLFIILFWAVGVENDFCFKAINLDERWNIGFLFNFFFFVFFSIGVWHVVSFEWKCDLWCFYCPFVNFHASKFLYAVCFLKFNYKTSFFFFFFSLHWLSYSINFVFEVVQLFRNDTKIYFFSPFIRIIWLLKCIFRSLPTFPLIFQFLMQKGKSYIR